MTEECQGSLEFFCTGCNKTTQALVWSHHERQVAYASSNSVVVFDPMPEDGTASKIVSILNKHTSRVNCVCWLEKECTELVTGSVDKSIVVWHKLNNKWECKQVLQGHTGAVDSIAAFFNSETGSYIVSAGADSTVRVWKASTGKTSQEFICSQTISFGNGFALSLSLSSLPKSNDLLLAVGKDDTSIGLYALNTSSQFDQVITLSGHEDWVRCLTFQRNEDELMLASGSQDTFVRLWKVTSKCLKDEESTNSVTLETQSFQAYSKDFTVVLESVLIGHEGWVLGLSWDCSKNSSCLVSASMDRTLIIWEYDKENEIWMDKARFGEVGGNTLGYYGCSFSSCGNALVAHGYHGSFQLWIKDDQEKWTASATLSGHFGEVEDFDWSSDGGFVITASTDQTTRLFAPWKRSTHKTTWNEIARPQIHGYDMKCITILNKYKYVSGAQEKVSRVFGAPKSFYNSLACISKLNNDEDTLKELPVGATVPVLGLSNKAVYDADIQTWSEQNKDKSKQMKASAFADEDPVPFNPTLVSTPPVEDVLLQHTLWPELQKLYGHGFELFSMASDPDGSTLATACKASKAEHANILVWNTTTWLQTDSLRDAHSLTVTQMCFSNSGKYLLSVSRDRTWALHRRGDDNNEKYKFKLLQKTDKKTSVHSRIIWSCDWCPGDKHFVTVSRDKNALVWGEDTSTQCWCVQSNHLDMGESINAVSVNRKIRENKSYLIGLGLESGKISLYTWLGDWNIVLDVDPTLSPCLAVKRLRWRPTTHDEESVTDDDGTKKDQLGIASSDHSFRILNFYNIF